MARRYMRTPRTSRSTASATSQPPASNVPPADAAADSRPFYVKHYTSPVDLLLSAADHGIGSGNDVSWYGGTTKQCRDWALRGDPALVPAIEAHLKFIDATLPDTWQRTTRADVFGPRLNVADWLAGTATPFRRRVRAEVESAPVRIWIAGVCSAKIDAETMQKRAATICALVELVQQSRPVELILFGEHGSRKYAAALCAVRLGVAPLGLAALAGVLCHVGFVRRFFYGTMLRDAEFNGTWPSEYGYDANINPAYKIKRAEALDIQPQDVVIEAARSWDPLVEQPLQWINTQLREIAEGSEAYV